MWYIFNLNSTWIVGGASAGAVAAALTCPMDVIKTRIQVSEKSLGIFQVLNKMIAEEGYRAFTKVFQIESQVEISSWTETIWLSKGLTARVLWIAPGTAITIAVCKFSTWNSTWKFIQLKNSHATWKIRLISSCHLHWDKFIQFQVEFNLNWSAKTNKWRGCFEYVLFYFPRRISSASDELNRTCISFSESISDTIHSFHQTDDLFFDSMSFDYDTVAISSVGNAMTLMLTFITWQRYVLMMGCDRLNSKGFFPLSVFAVRSAPCRWIRLDVLEWWCFDRVVMMHSLD